MNAQTQLFAHLRRGGKVGFWWLVTPAKNKTSMWWEVDNPTALRAGHVAAGDLYFGVHPAVDIPQRGDPAKLRAKIEELAAVNCVFAEFDAKDFGGDKVATLAHIDGLAAAPSVIVDSGGGYHCYWLLRAPFLLTTNEERERARRVQAAWVAYVGGDMGAKDLARVLRVPSTWNYKYDPPRKVVILRADYDRLYNLPDLEALAQPAERRPATNGNGNGRGPSEDAGQHWLDWALARARVGNRNQTGFDMACQLRDDHVDMTAAEGWLLAYARSVPQHSKDFYSEREALASLREAYKTGAREPSRAVGATTHANGTTPSYAPTAAEEPPGWMGETDADMADAGASQPSAPTVLAAKPSRKKIKSGDLIEFLNARGYNFRLNLTDDAVEVGGERLTDVMRSKMRCALRDGGLVQYLAAADDAMVADAAEHAYHPVRDYLAGLTWDGKDHIAQLASHVTDANGVFGLYLRKWLIGAIARAYTGSQNAVLVLDGPQGLGKSQFVNWLCPLSRLFVDSNLNPDDKDCSLLAIRCFMWEVSELGATTKRADVEALKGFLSREVFTLRPPYGRFEIVKPGLVSFVGTVNNSSGIFSDPTGSRRYWATTLTAIDWNYAQHVKLDQVWAEAHAAYRSGEVWRLSPAEAQQARTINEDYAVVDPYEDLLRKYYELDPARVDKWTSSADILTTLQANGLGNAARSNAMQLSATLRRLGHEKRKVGTVNAYVGVW